MWRRLPVSECSTRRKLSCSTVRREWGYRDSHAVRTESECHTLRCTPRMERGCRRASDRTRSGSAKRSKRTEEPRPYFRDTKTIRPVPFRREMTVIRSLHYSCHRTVPNRQHPTLPGPSATSKEPTMNLRDFFRQPLYSPPATECRCCPAKPDGDHPLVPSTPSHRDSPAPSPSHPRTTGRRRRETLPHRTECNRLIRERTQSGHPPSEHCHRALLRPESRPADQRREPDATRSNFRRTDTDPSRS